MKTPEVGSVWWAKIDRPLGAEIEKGDTVYVEDVRLVADEFGERSGWVYYVPVGEVYVPPWAALLSTWDNYFTPLNKKAPTDLTAGAEDNVNSPRHYGQGTIEAIDYIEDFLTEEEYIGYLRGNIAKYMHRFRYKGKDLEDLKKAEWYQKRLIKTFESRQKETTK